MKIVLKDGLPFVVVTVAYGGKSLQLADVLLDTGSAGCVFSVDRLLEIGVTYEPEDTIHRIRGIGGSEFVFSKTLDGLALGDLVAREFEVEVGAMDYGFALDGIIGMDYLMRLGVVIDLATFSIYR